MGTSGWVQVIYHHKPGASDCTLMKAQVKPLWRVTEESHQKWVAVHRVLEVKCPVGTRQQHSGRLATEQERASGKCNFFEEEPLLQHSGW